MPHLKAAEFSDETTQPIGFATTLLPLPGRQGYAFALLAYDAKRPSPDIAQAGRIVREHIERLVNAFGTDANPQHRFELFLAALNEAMSNEVRESDWKLPIKEFRGVVGIACDDRMYLSGNGDLTAIYLHRTPSQRYQVFNLSRSIQTEQALPTWEKPFAVVLDGDIHPGDVFCLANRDLGHVIDPEELCAILATLPPAGAAAKLRQFLPPNATFASIVVRAEDPSAPPILESARPRSELSLNELGAAREETAKLLSDETPRLTSLLAFVQSIFRSERGAVPGAGRPSLISRVSRGAMKQVLSVFRRIGSPKTRSVQDPNEMSHERQHTNERLAVRVRTQLKNVPVKSRYLALATLVVFMTLGVGIHLLARASANQKAASAFDSALAASQDLREQGSAALLYRDETRARSLYQDAEKQLESLVAITDDQRERLQRAHDDIESAQRELRHEVRLSDVPVLANLGTLGVNDARALVSDGPTLIALDAASRAYRIDPTSKTASALTGAIGAVGAPLNASFDKGNIYTIDARPGISRIDAKDGASQVTALTPAAGATWQDLAAYAGRLYILSRENGDAQVLRSTATSGGFGAPTGWIRSKTISLSDAVALAIDSNIFVLKDNGVIARFVSGGQAGWDAGLVDPPLEHPLDIWTSNESAFLYILEASHHRVVVYRKDTGAFVTQYVAEAFNTAKDFVVDESARTIYVLAGTTIYAFRVGHL